MPTFLRPGFFDIFGLAVFAFLGIVSAWSRKTGRPSPRWATAILLAIAVLGLLVDGAIVYITYIRGQVDP